MFLYAKKIGLAQKDVHKDLVNVFDQHAADNSIQDILVLSEISHGNSKVNGIIVKVLSNQVNIWSKKLQKFERRIKVLLSELNIDQEKIGS